MERVDKLFILSKIKKSEGDENFKKNLNNIILYLDKLKKININGINEFKYSWMRKLKMRGDNIDISIGNDGLKYCIKTENGYIQVPKVL